MRKSKSLKIVRVDYGIASRYDDLIEIHKKLPKILVQKVLNHEKAHTSGKYTLQDFKVDFQSKKPYFLDTLLFCLKHPEGFINFLPIMYSYYLKTFTFNTTSLFIIGFYGLIFSIMSTLFFGVNMLLAFLAFINIIIVANAVLLIYTHIHVKGK